MNRILSFALIITGLVLIVYGIRASDSVGSSFSRLFTGAPTDKTVWLLISGVLAIALGGGLFGRSRVN